MRKVKKIAAKKVAKKAVTKTKAKATVNAKNKTKASKPAIKAATTRLVKKSAATKKTVAARKPAAKAKPAAKKPAAPAKAVKKPAAKPAKKAVKKTSEPKKQAFIPFIKRKALGLIEGLFGSSEKQTAPKEPTTAESKKAAPAASPAPVKVGKSSVIPATRTPINTPAQAPAKKATSEPAIGLHSHMIIDHHNQ